MHNHFHARGRAKFLDHDGLYHENATCFIGFFISFTKLEHNMVWANRKDIEEEICNILGPE